MKYNLRPYFSIESYYYIVFYRVTLPEFSFSSGYQQDPLLIGKDAVDDFHLIFPEYL